MKILLLVLAVVVLSGFAGLLFLGSSSSGPGSGSSISSSAADGAAPTFAVRIDRPRLGRFLFGILPSEWEDRMRGSAERFDHASPGATPGRFELGDGKGPEPGFRRLELVAEGWHLSLEIDAEGRPGSATSLVFPFAVGDRRPSVRCRPADPPVGVVRVETRAGDDGPVPVRASGSFVIELVACENAESGRAIDWPPAPPMGLPPASLEVHGSFARLPVSRRSGA